MKVAILGVGSTAMIAADIITESHNFSLAGFVGTEEEKEKLSRSKIYGEIPFLGDHSILNHLGKVSINKFIAAIGDNNIREKRYYQAIQSGMSAISAISRNAFIHQSVTIRDGVIVSPGSVICHGAEIGENCILDPSVVIDVDTTIGPNCYIYPSVTICVGCTIEKNVTLGAGCIIEPNRFIGKNQSVAAGTVVREDLEGLYKETVEDYE